MPVEWETFDLPLIAGMRNRQHDYVLEAPGLIDARDVQMDEVGCLTMRPQFQEILDAASNSLGSILRCYEYDGGLIAFTATNIWTYSAGDGLWTDRGEYLAPKVSEEPRFVTTGDQYNCDRAELGGVILYSWTEDDVFNPVSYVAAVDATTGAVKMAPSGLGANSRSARLFAASGVIFLAYYNTNTLHVRAYDPSDLTYNSASATVTGISAFDICSDGGTGAIVASNAGGTSYDLRIFNASAVEQLNDSRTTTVSGPIACDYDSSDDVLAVIFNNGTSVLADIRDDELSSVDTDVAMGTASSATVNQVSAIRTGQGEFEVFWSAGEAVDDTSFYSRFNTLSFDGASTGSAGANTALALRCGLASKPFRYNSETFIWTVFAAESSGLVTAQLQNVYLLYKSDGTLIGKAIPQQAGGFSGSTGHLPSAQSLGSSRYAFAGQYRRIIPLGDDSRGYAARSLQDIVVEFGSNEARRVAKLGETLYVSGSIPLQFDGRNLTEIGFLSFPFNLSIVTGAAGSLNGTYNWQQTWSWFNAKGEFERSTTATIYAQAMTNDEANFTYLNLPTTLKEAVAVEIWRQEADAALGANFFLTTSKDPSSSGDNKYITNNPGIFNDTYTDALSDANLTELEPYPENGGLVLASLPPAGCSIIEATQDRLILAGIPGNPNRIAYSKLRGAGEVAAFNEALVLDLPSDGGAITALGFLNETLIAFKGRAIYAIAGDGFDNTGGGQNYGPARLLSADVGAESAEAVALTPQGLIFKSEKGWHLLDQGWQVRYIGAAVSDYDGEAVTCVHVMASKQQVRCVTSGRTLIWDYLVNEWFWWDVSPRHAVIWDGDYHITNGSTLRVESATHTGSDDGPWPLVESAWIKTGGVNGFQRARRLLLLGERLDDCAIRLRVAYNYDNSWVDDRSWVPDSGSVPFQMRHDFSRQKCTAFKVQIQVASDADPAAEPDTLAAKLVGLSVQFGLKPGLNKSLALSQYSGQSAAGGGGGGPGGGGGGG